MGAAHPGRPVDYVAGADVEDVAFDISDDAAAGDDVMKRLDQMPMQVLVRAGTEGRQPDADALARMLGATGELPDREAFYDSR